MSTYEQWSEAMAAELKDASYDWKRVALALLGLTVTVWKTDHDPRYRIACDLGGLEVYVAADNRKVAALRRAKGARGQGSHGAICDLYVSK